MAITLHVSFITLTYCVFILSMCQMNPTLARSLKQYKNHPVPLQQQDGQLAFFNEYLRQHYPVII